MKYSLIGAGSVIAFQTVAREAFTTVETSALLSEISELFVDILLILVLGAAVDTEALADRLVAQLDG